MNRVGQVDFSINLFTCKNLSFIVVPLVYDKKTQFIKIQQITDGCIGKISRLLLSYKLNLSCFFITICKRRSPTKVVSLGSEAKKTILICLTLGTATPDFVVGLIICQMT